MKRMKTTGLWLVAMLALGAFAASSAFALPEVGRCQPSTIGKYKTANCTTKATLKEKAITEKWEWHKGAQAELVGVHFTSEGGEGTLETEAGTKITCKTQSATGKYDQDVGVIKEVEGVVSTFKECELPLLSASCKTAGAAEGEIKTNLLKGPLGYISGEKTTSPVIGQQLTPEKAKGAVTSFECAGGAVKVIVKGKEGKFKLGETEVSGGNCVIAPLAEVNVMTTTVSQTYSGAGGKQSPQKFQKATAKFCNLLSNTNGGPFEAATQSLTTTITNEEALEVKA